jgi:hypothetical protein
MTKTIKNTLRTVIFLVEIVFEYFISSYGSTAQIGPWPLEYFHGMAYLNMAMQSQLINRKY